jgi:hypothetical protein
LNKFASRRKDGPVSPLCSRNARPQQALVGRAQWGGLIRVTLRVYKPSQRGRTLFGRSLRPCWTTFLNSLPVLRESSVTVCSLSFSFPGRLFNPCQPGIDVRSDFAELLRDDGCRFGSTGWGRRRQRGH